MRLRIQLESHLDSRFSFWMKEVLFLDTEIFQMGPEPTAILRREIAYGPTGRSIDIIRNTSSITFNAINNGDNSSTSSQSNSLATLKSSGKFMVRLK